ncbi:hypothetical protein QP297_25245, partial [Escherichia coli]|nr:hypothetical protein [Escherichia coli]
QTVFYATCKSTSFPLEGYEGEENLVLDDFLPYNFLDTFRNVCDDKKPVKINIKGGMINFCAKRIIIISNKPISTFFGLTTEDFYTKQSIYRRFLQSSGSGIFYPDQFDFSKPITDKEIFSGDRLQLWKSLEHPEKEPAYISKKYLELPSSKSDSIEPYDDCIDVLKRFINENYNVFQSIL